MKISKLRSAAAAAAMRMGGGGGILNQRTSNADAFAGSKNIKSFPARKSSKTRNRIYLEYKTHRAVILKCILLPV